MSTIPADLLYTRTHEWVRRESDGSVTIGITDHAQNLLGDMVFVEVPEAGRQFALGEDCAVVESVKAASDVYSPLTGEVIEGNEELAGSPETINQDPYHDGWIFKLQPGDAAELDDLLSAEDYQELVNSETH